MATRALEKAGKKLRDQGRKLGKHYESSQPVIANVPEARIAQKTEEAFWLSQLKHENGLQN
jgi:hypothetical protein